MYLATTGRRDTPAPPRSGGAGRRVPGTVLALGTVSLVTDVSSEMVTAVLPLYLVLGLGLSPLQFGFLDGLFNGAAAIVRLLGGYAADHGRGHKRVAGLGYALSALSRIGLLLAGGATAGIAAALATDRVGKGIRTAPRDALITLSSPPEALGRSFGVHRAMDTTGALLGPLAAFALLWATADAYDAVFVVSFCVGLLGVLLLVLYVPAHQPAPPPLIPAPAGARPSGRSATPPSGGSSRRPPCSVPPPSATPSSTSCSSNGSTSPSAGSRCCRSAPRRATCCWPYRPAGSPTGSADGCRSSTDTSHCSACTPPCSHPSAARPCCSWCPSSPCSASSTPPPTEC